MNIHCERMNVPGWALTLHQNTNRSNGSNDYFVHATMTNRIGPGRTDDGHAKDKVMLKDNSRQGLGARWKGTEEVDETRRLDEHSLYSAKHSVAQGRPISPEKWARIRAAEQEQKHGAAIRSIAKFYSKSQCIRWMLPYGIWRDKNGRLIIHDRTYTPLLQKSPGQPVMMADPAEWVRHIKHQAWFYNDGTPEKEKRRRAVEVLETWGMAQVVLDAANHLHSLIRVRRGRHA